MGGILRGIWGGVKSSGLLISPFLFLSLFKEHEERDTFTISNFKISDFRFQISFSFQRFASSRYPTPWTVLIQRGFSGSGSILPRRLAM
jgi:hypothetical protein